MDMHFKELGKYHLQVNDWTIEPLDNERHDFVNELLKRYLDDLRIRQRASEPGKASFASTIRKEMKLN